jgi:hypothetical protein
VCHLCEREQKKQEILCMQRQIFQRDVHCIEYSVFDQMRGLLSILKGQLGDAVETMRACWAGRW